MDIFYESKIVKNLAGYFTVETIVRWQMCSHDPSPPHILNNKCKASEDLNISFPRRVKTHDTREKSFLFFFLIKCTNFFLYLSILPNLAHFI